MSLAAVASGQHVNIAAGSGGSGGGIAVQYRYVSHLYGIVFAILTKVLNALGA